MCLPCQSHPDIPKHTLGTSTTTRGPKISSATGGGQIWPPPWHYVKSRLCPYWRNGAPDLEVWDQRQPCRRHRPLRTRPRILLPFPRTSQTRRKSDCLGLRRPIFGVFGTCTPRGRKIEVESVVGDNIEYIPELFRFLHRHFVGVIPHTNQKTCFEPNYNGVLL